MSCVIRLDQVLRETVTTPYRDLVTRQTGAAVRNRVLTVLRDRPGTDAELDFTEVGLIDYSCADEIVAKLLALADLPSPRVLLRGVRDDHADAIGHALQRLGLVAVAIFADSGEPGLLGDVPDDFRAAFDHLRRAGRSAATPLADALGWPTARAAAALERLAELHCVFAHPDATFEFGAVA